MTTPEADRQPTTPPEPFPVSQPLPPAQPSAQPTTPPLQPQPAATQPQPTTPSRAPIVVLTVMATVFALAATVFTFLYFGERADRDGTAATRADRERVLAEVRGRQDELDRALGANRTREAALTTDNNLLSTCVEAAKQYFDLPPGQSPERSRVFRVMYDVCPKI
jgi:type IV secretory pathway VirB10-like protein